MLQRVETPSNWSYTKHLSTDWTIFIFYGMNCFYWRLIDPWEGRHSKFHAYDPVSVWVMATIRQRVFIFLPLAGQFRVYIISLNYYIRNIYQRANCSLQPLCLHATRRARLALEWLCWLREPLLRSCSGQLRKYIYTWGPENENQQTVTELDAILHCKVSRKTTDQHKKNRSFWVLWPLQQCNKKHLKCLSKLRV